MSPAPSEEYGTDDPRAFAHFVAGLFAERTGSLDAAAELYASAIRLDPDYHKALNNRGFLMQAEGAEAYVKGTDDTRAQRLLEDARGLFFRAKVLKGVAEYQYNLATTLSYLGRLELRTGNRSQARVRQIESMTTYLEATLSVNREIEQANEAGERPWWRKGVGGGDHEARRAERQAFRLSIQLALAISAVLFRELDNVTAPSAVEVAALKEVENSSTSRSRIPRHPQLEYNLACYYAVTKDFDQAKPLFTTLRAVYSNIGSRVSNDPDLAHIPEIMALFASPSATPPLTPTPRPPDPHDDPDRDEPT